MQVYTKYKQHEHGLHKVEYSFTLRVSKADNYEFLTKICFSLSSYCSRCISEVLKVLTKGMKDLKLLIIHCAIQSPYKYMYLYMLLQGNDWDNLLA